MLEEVKHNIVKNLAQKSKKPSSIGVGIFNGNEKDSFFLGTVSHNSTARVSSSSRWHIGSCGKSLTSTIARDLLSRLGISLQEKVGFFLPELNMSNRIEDIRLEELLTHTSGLVDVPLHVLRDVFEQNPVPVNFRSELASHLLEKGIGFTGQRGKFVYSNFGYILIGYIVDVLCGSYEMALKSYFSNSLNLSTLGIGVPPVLEDGTPNPVGHIDGVPIASGKQGDNHPGFAPAGCMYMTVEDWMRYAKFILPTLKERTQKSSENLSYVAEGFIPVKWNSGTEYCHSGSNTFWFASVSIFPEQDTGLVVATNWGGENSACWVNSLCQEWARVKLGGAKI